MIPSLRNYNNETRLEKVNVFSLEIRRFRGQLIEVFKC